MLRRNVTLSLDDEFLAYMDARRGETPRSRWIEERPDLDSPEGDSVPLGAPAKAANRADAFRDATQKRKP